MTHPRSAFGAPPPGGAAGGPAEPDPRRPLGRRLRGFAIYGAAVATLGLVFASYLSPHLIVDLAGRLWACF